MVSGFIKSDLIYSSLVDAVTSTSQDATQVTSSPIPKPHDIAYDDLLNQVSQDPMPTLGASVEQVTNPAQPTASQPTYGRSYSTQTTDNSALTSLQADSAQTTSPASMANSYGTTPSAYSALSYDWSHFGPCTTTCGQGYKRRVRRCDVPQRCPDKIDEDVQLCYNAPCEGTKMSLIIVSVKVLLNYATCLANLLRHKTQAK